MLVTNGWRMYSSFSLQFPFPSLIPSQTCGYISNGYCAVSLFSGCAGLSWSRCCLITTTQSQLCSTWLGCNKEGWHRASCWLAAKVAPNSLVKLGTGGQWRTVVSKGTSLRRRWRSLSLGMAPCTAWLHQEGHQPLQTATLGPWARLALQCGTVGGCHNCVPLCHYCISWESCYMCGEHVCWPARWGSTYWSGESWEGAGRTEPLGEALCAESDFQPRLFVHTVDFK